MSDSPREAHTPTAVQRWFCVGSPQKVITNPQTEDERGPFFVSLADYKATVAQQAEEIARLRAGLEREKERGQKHMDDAIAAESQVQALQTKLAETQQSVISGEEWAAIQRELAASSAPVGVKIHEAIRAIATQLSDAQQRIETLTAERDAVRDAAEHNLANMRALQQALGLIAPQEDQP